MYQAVKEVKAQNNYLLWLTFKNGEQRIFDMKPFLEFGLFKGIKDKNIFKNVKVSFDTVEWPNQADIDPEVLYKDSIAVKLWQKYFFNITHNKTANGIVQNQQVNMCWLLVKKIAFAHICKFRIKR